jgi:hypothetical protein
LHLDRNGCAVSGWEKREPDVFWLREPPDKEAEAAGDDSASEEQV